MRHSEPPTPRSLSELADTLRADLVGDGDFIVTSVDHPTHAGSEHTLALATDAETFAALGATRAKAVAVADGATIDLNRFAGGLVVKRPRYARAILSDLFAKPLHGVDGVSPQSLVDEQATLADDVSVGAFSYIGPKARIGAGTAIMDNVTIGAEAEIGQNCLIHSGARIGERVRIGDNVIIHSNAVIGSDGFSFVTPEVGSVETAKRTGKIEARNLAIVRMHSNGTVVIGDDVEIGAGSTVDRATLGATTISRGTKIDNLVNVGHNCRIGENCLFAGQTGISGSVEIGDRVVFGGQVGIADHLTIGDDAIVVAGSGVGRNVPPKEVQGGYPAGPWKEKLEAMLNVTRLSRIVRDVVNLKRRVADIENRRGAVD